MFEILLKYNNFYEMFAPLMKGNHIFNKFFSESLHDRTSIKYLLFHTGDDNFLRESMLQMFDNQLNQDAYTDQFLTGHLIINSVYLIRNYSSSVEIGISHSSNLPDDFLVMSYIQENLATISLADVAKHFNFSISHCSRLIKKATGYGFNEWKRILRLKRAQQLLANTNYNIVEKTLHRKNISCLFITHDLALLPQIANGVIVMHDGNIAEEGKTDDVINNPKSEFTKELVLADLFNL